ncbi:MAG: DUF4272 domain-containing protein [Chloroflexi bacterium]|nr:DUF4272 domain-containing protein [Chloroflexota bacterium]
MRPSNREAYSRLTVLKAVIVHALANPPVTTEQSSKWSEQERQDFENHGREQAEALVQNMKNIGSWRHASPQEAKFLQTYGIAMDRQEHIDAIWRKECACVLMWALGLRETWPNIDQETAPETISAIPIQKIGLFFRYPILKSRLELSIKRDLLEAWHWRVRTRQLVEEGHPFPVDEMKKLGFSCFDDIVRFSAKAHYEKGDIIEIIDEDYVFLGKAFRSLAAGEFQFAGSIISERHFAMNWLCGMAPENRWDETPTST